MTRLDIGFITSLESISGFVRFVCEILSHTRSH